MYEENELSMQKRPGSLLHEEEGFSARKRMRSHDFSPDTSQRPRWNSTPIPTDRGRLRHPRVSDIASLSDTLCISFTGAKDLESPYYDKSKSKEFFKSCFEVVEELGVGSFGSVMKCRSKDDGKLYAVKMVKRELSTMSVRDDVLREVKAFEGFEHPNIVRFYKAWLEGKHLYIQTELCAGNLLSFLTNLVQPNPIADEPYMRPEKVPEELCWNILVDILQGARYLHEKCVIHLDIKPENILIGIEDASCKLGDFGTAWNFKKDERKSAQEGDGRYAAPETFQKGAYTVKADTFSIGCTILQFALGILNPRHARYQDTWADLKLCTEEWDQRFPEQMSGKSTELWSTIKLLLTRDMEKRPTPQTILDDEDMKRRVEERRKQLSKSAFMYRLRSMASNVLQVLTLFLPRDLMSRLRPLMNANATASPSPRRPTLAAPSTPSTSFEERSSRHLSSPRSSSTPSRIVSYSDTSLNEDNMSLSGRINLTSRFDDVDLSNEGHEHSDDIVSLDISPIKKLTDSQS